MMDAFRETAGPDANLQTLARGVNVVGLEIRHGPSSGGDELSRRTR